MPLRPPTTVLIGLTAAVAAAVLPALPAAAVPSTTVVVNELHTNNQPGQFDTFVELRNVSAGPVDISGWQLFGCNGSRDTGLRATIDPGTELAAGEHYLLTAEGYGDSYDVPGDQALSTSLTPDGGIRLVDSAGSPVDAVGHQAEACVEGNPAPQPADRQQTVSRDAAGTDTDNNANDFSVGAATPTASAEDSAPDPGGETPSPVPAQEPVEALVPTGDPAVEMVVEAESLLPEVAATAKLAAPGNCCGIVRYGDGALTFGGGRSGEVGDFFTVALDVPRDGRYELGGAYTLDPSFAGFQLSVDGVDLGEPVDLYARVVTTAPRIVHGIIDLTAGRHELTFTVTAPNPLSSVDKGHRISVDLLRLRQLPTEGRLTLSPQDGQVVRGLLPVYGWSTDPADSLSLRVDGAPVEDRPALASGPILVFEGSGLQGGSLGFRNVVRVRGQETPLASDVDGFATDWVDLPGELFAPGPNVVTIETGTAPDSTNGNKDDFEVRNLRLVMPDGTVLTDPQRGDSYALGDGCCPDPASNKATSLDLVFTVPPTPEPGSTEPARGHVLDTAGLADGEHTVTLAAEGPQGSATRTATVLVDNTGPTVDTTTPTDGERLKGDFRIDATASDAGSGLAALTATLDGQPVELGATLSTDDLADGDHTVVFTAVDVAGNSTERTVAVTSVREQPDAPELIAPADGATGVSTRPELRVRASDPAGDSLDVTFLQALTSAPRAGAGSTGATPVAPPGGLPSGGAALDEQQARAATSSDGVYADAAPSDAFPYQLYDLRVPEDAEVSSVEVSWEGRTAPERQVVLSVLDVAAQTWTPVASARGAEDGSDITLTGAVELAQALDGDVVHVLVQGVDPFADDIVDPVDEQFKDPADYDFALAWMTDTQYLSEGAVQGRPGFGEAYTGINQWIADNAEERKIAYAAHTGDLINNWSSVNNNTPEYEARARKEFQFASDAMDILEDAGMPYGVTPGNHDGKTGTTNDLYNEYFPPSRYEAAEDTASTGEDGEGYYGGSWKEGDNQNHFDLFEAGNQKLILVYLGYVAGQEEIDWANGVLEQYADRKAIFLTHEYLRPSGDAEGRGGALSDENARSQGLELFEEVVLANDNVFLTLSGHTHGVALNIKRDVGEQGRTVVEMLANYQFYEVDGERRAGHFRLLQFDVDASEMAVNTYSPVLDDHNADEFDTSNSRDYVPAADEFSVPVDLASRTTSFGTDAIGLEIRTDRVIGTQRVESEETASATWKGLKKDSDYAFYAVAADDFGGVAASDVFRFTTGEGKKTDRTTGRPDDVVRPGEPGRSAFDPPGRSAADRRPARQVP